MASINSMFTIPDLSRRESESVGAKPQTSKYADRYRTCNQLGKGGFGTVKSCVSIEDGGEYAVKVVEKATHSSVHDEVEILQLLRSTHPNFVQLKEVFETRTKIYIVMEMVKGGMLLRQIERSKNFSEATARRMVKQLLIAVEFMHGKGIVHRDLKPANLLLTESNIDATIKICDFGFARLVGEDHTIIGRTGTLLFMAPEVIAGQGAYGKPVDLWSLGVIFYIMLSGTPPFARGDQQGQSSRRYHTVSKMRHVDVQDSDEAEAGRAEQGGRAEKQRRNRVTIDEDRRTITKQILAAKVRFPQDTIWDSVSAECKDFLRQLMTKHPYERSTASDALAHPWIRDEISLSTRNLKDEREQFNDSLSLKSAALATMALHKLLFSVRVKGLRGLNTDITMSNVLHRTLRLRQLQGEVEAAQIADYLRNDNYGKQITTFKAADCGIDDAAAALLLEGLTGHAGVQVVDMSRNPITSSTERLLIRLISGTPKLAKLQLRGTEMDDHVVERVVSSVGVLPASPSPASVVTPLSQQLRGFTFATPQSLSSHRSNRLRNTVPKKPAVPTIATLKHEQKERETLSPLSSQGRNILSSSVSSSANVGSVPRRGNSHPVSKSGGLVPLHTKQLGTIK